MSPQIAMVPGPLTVVEQLCTTSHAGLCFNGTAQPKLFKPQAVNYSQNWKVKKDLKMCSPSPTNKELGDNSNVYHTMFASAQFL